MKIIKLAAILAIGLTVGSTLASAEVNLAVCKGCHGQHFEKRAFGKSDIVKNMSSSSIYSALVSYKSTTESDEMIMKSQVSRYSDADLKKASKAIKKL